MRNVIARVPFRLAVGLLVISSILSGACSPSAPAAAGLEAKDMGAPHSPAGSVASSVSIAAAVVTPTPGLALATPSEEPPIGVGEISGLSISQAAPAPADQPAAAPTETASLLLTPTATVSTPAVDDSVSTPTPASSASDGIEFLQLDSVSSSQKQDPITVAGSDSPQKGATGATDPVQGEPYTWQDGDRTMTAKLQTDLVVEKGPDGLPRDIVSASEDGTNVVRSADEQSRSDTLPVFRSESGALMTLPGGVLLVLSSEWSQAETNAFFSDNGIKKDRVSELDYVANGFFIETEPGFPSLDLANALAAQDGVEISSPNWGREATKK